VKRTTVCAVLALLSHARPTTADPVEDAAWIERLTLAAEPGSGCQQRGMAWFYALDRVVWNKVRALTGPDRTTQLRGVGMIDGARSGADDFARHFHIADPCNTVVNFLALSEIDPEVKAAEKIGGNVDLPRPHNIPVAVTQYASFGQIVGIRLECGQRSAAWGAAARIKLAPDIAGQDGYLDGKLDAADTAYLRGYEQMMERWGRWEVTIIRPQLCAFTNNGRFPNTALVDGLAGGAK